MYSNDSLEIVMWDHRPAGRFAPQGKIGDILRAAIKSRFFADMLSLRMWYSVKYRLLHTCNFFQMLMQIDRSNWGHLQNGALCPMLLYYYSSPVRKNLSSKFDEFLAARSKLDEFLAARSKLDEFLAARSKFDSDHRVDFYTHTCCQSAITGPLFCVLLSFVFYDFFLTMSHFARCDVYAALFALDVATALRHINR